MTWAPWTIQNKNPSKLTCPQLSLHPPSPSRLLMLIGLSSKGHVLRETLSLNFDWKSRSIRVRWWCQSTQIKIEQKRSFFGRWFSSDITIIRLLLNVLLSSNSKIICHWVTVQFVLGRQSVRATVITFCKRVFYCLVSFRTV